MILTIVIIIVSLAVLVFVFAFLFGKSPDEEIIWKKLDDHEKMLGE